MIAFDRLFDWTFSLAVNYLNWVSQSALDEFNLPHLSLIICGSWLLLFVFWFGKHALQAPESSKLHRILKSLGDLTLTVLLLFIVGTLGVCYLVYIQHARRDWLLEWMMVYLAKPFIATSIGLAIVGLILAWIAVRYWIPKINHWLNERITKKAIKMRALVIFAILMTSSPRRLIMIQLDIGNYQKIRCLSVWIRT